jgi:hypothetical protein
MERPPTVRIKLIQNYSTYRVGEVIDIEPAALAHRLVADGIAVRDGQTDLFVEQATAEPVTEQADARPKRRGRPPRAIPQPESDG